MKKVLLLTVIFSLLIFSCKDPDESPKDKNKFWAMNFSVHPYTYYQLDADLLGNGLYCNVWVERGSGVSQMQAQQIANEFDSNIYSQMVDNFSIKNFSYSGLTFSNILTFSDWLGNRDGKLCILLLDIKDNYQKGVNDSYVAGYFWPGDLVTSSYLFAVSNRRDIIFVDTNPGFERPQEVFNVIVHELQHLMNFATSFISRYEIKGNTRHINSMDTWIDEGLSSAAEYIYSGHSNNRIDWFINNGKGADRGLINKGNNFFIWGNRENENKYAVLDDYSTVYLFFQWLRLQSDNSVYGDIIASSSSNYNAVLSAFNNRIVNKYSNWGSLLKDWLTANYTNDSNTIHGYKNDPAFKDLKSHTYPAGTSNVQLFAGEGVYSIIPGDFSMPADSGNIRYSALNSDEVLLTYNINTNNTMLTETGITTGVAANINITEPFAGRSVMDSLGGPYRIGVWRLNAQE